LDLLAVDATGKAVIVAIRRQDDQDALNRALVIASLVADWKPEDFKSCLDERRSGELAEYLNVEIDQLNQRQRIILLSEHFAAETLAASKWLGRNHGVDISCLRLAMYSDIGAGDRYLTCRDQPPDGGRAELAGAVGVVAEFSPPVARAASGEVSLEPAAEAAVSGEPVEGSAEGLEPEEVEAALLFAVAEESDVAVESAVVDDTASLATAASSDVVLSEIVEELVKKAESPDQPAPPLKRENAADAAAPPERLVEVDYGERPFTFVPRPWMALSAAAAIIVLAAAVMTDDLFTPESDSASRVAAATIEPEPTPHPMLLTGTVADRATGQPIRGASVHYASQRYSTDDAGQFQFSREPVEASVFVRAAGYRQTELSAGGSLAAQLEAFAVRAVYLSQNAMEAPDRFERVQELLRDSRLNSVIVAVKGPRGHLSLETGHPLARGRGSRRRLLNRNLAGEVNRWRREGVYTIAYVALFRDNSIASARPELALRSLTTRQIIRDASGMGWTDPAAPDVRAYNIAVAKAAAEAGFDEIQFDFVRYPATIESAEGVTSEVRRQRLETITSFLREATTALAPENVYVSASVLGSVCTMRTIGSVGQRLEEFASAVDYVCPMLYPSSFAPSRRHPEPLEKSFELVSENLVQATSRLKGLGKKLRPWLQTFSAERSSRAPLAPAFIRSQIKGVAATHASGWMLWDGTSRYGGTLEALDDVSKDATTRSDAIPPDQVQEFATK